LIPCPAHSSISSENGVFSSSQHQGMQAETFSTKADFNTCVQYAPSRGTAERHRAAVKRDTFAWFPNASDGQLGRRRVKGPFGLRKCLHGCLDEFIHLFARK